MALAPRLARFVVALALLAGIWLALLPRLASRPAVRQWVEIQDRHQVDPSVLFYAELRPLRDDTGRVIADPALRSSRTARTD